jgi:hypothetical protein
MASSRRNTARARITKVHTCEGFSKILVLGLAPGTSPAGVKCTSDRDFLVYCSTNYPGSAAPPSWGYSVAVKSTGATLGSAAPMYIVGGGAKDVITITMLPGTTGFITLHTRSHAKASITPT